MRLQAADYFCILLWNPSHSEPIRWRRVFPRLGGEQENDMSAVAVRALFRSHPERPAHTESMSRCIDASFNCVETCTACADACLAERDIGHLVARIRLNLDCAAVCNATGN